MTSLTTASPWASAARRSSFRPSSPSPWNAYGDVRGLYAPPRSTVAPASATARAIVNTCSSPSTEHGPAMIASCDPPIATRPTVITVSWGWNARLASLNGRASRLTDSTAGQASTSFQSTAPGSPTAATRTRPSCSVRCTASPAMRSRETTLATPASGVPGFRTTSMGSPPPQRKSPRRSVWAGRSGSCSSSEEVRTERVLPAAPPRAPVPHPDPRISPQRLLLPQAAATEPNGEPNTRKSRGSKATPQRQPRRCPPPREAGERVRSLLLPAADRALLEPRVGERDGQHGLPHGHDARADARVVAALDRNGLRAALALRHHLGLADAGGRPHRHAHHD